MTSLLPPLTYDSIFWICIGGLTTAVAVVLVAWGLGRFTIVAVLWTLTAWFGGTGLLFQGLGLWYEMTIPKADGLLMLVVGTAMLALAGIVATIASKIQVERKLTGMFPKQIKS